MTSAAIILNVSIYIIVLGGKKKKSISHCKEMPSQILVDKNLVNYGDVRF